MITDALSVARPDATLTSEGTTRTAGDADRRAGRLTAALAAAGIGRGDRVALLAFNELEFFELQCACQRLGAIFVPLNFRLSVAEHRFFLQDCRPSLLVVGPGHEATAAQLEASLTWRLGAEYEAALTNAGAPVGTALDPDAIAQILYTSGTTGRPKGAMVSNRALDVRCQSVADAMDTGPDDVLLQAGPLFHLISTVSLGVLLRGGSHVSVRAFDPPAWLDLIEEHGATSAFLVPTMLQVLCGMRGSSAADTGSLDLIIYGASPITEALLEQGKDVFGCDFAQMYGMTETGAATLLSRDDHRAGTNLRSAGRAVPGFEVDAADQEIVIRSAAVMTGYWEAPDATRGALRDGWMHTGDAGHLDDEGYVFITDRIKDLVITGGENVSGPEVEAALAGHGSVADVAVIAVPDERWGQRVHAVVVLAEGAELDPDGLTAHCREQLAGYKLPRSFSTVDQLPRNAMGKVLKHVLRSAFSAG